MFGRTSQHAGEIALDVLPNLPRDAWELARFWMTLDQSFVAVGHLERWTPELLGSLLVECLHTAAEGYAAAGSMSESQALQRMWRGLDEERKRIGLPERPEENQ